MKISETLTFYTPKASTGNGAILVDAGISAGFPSVAEDICETRISLDDELIRNKDTTFFAKVKGQSMIDAGLDDNDLFSMINHQSKLNKLEASKNEISVDLKKIKHTLNQLKYTSELERYAREEKFFKKQDEDIFVVTYE